MKSYHLGMRNGDASTPRCEGRSLPGKQRGPARGPGRCRLISFLTRVVYNQRRSSGPSAPPSARFAPPVGGEPPRAWGGRRGAGSGRGSSSPRFLRAWVPSKGASRAPRPPPTRGSSRPGRGRRLPACSGAGGRRSRDGGGAGRRGLCHPLRVCLEPWKGELALRLVAGRIPVQFGSSEVLGKRL